MRKQALLRAAVGFPTGIAIGQAICVLLSLFWGQGRYLACMPQLIEALGDEARAVAAQTLVCGAVGSVCAAGSIIWQLERWSLLRQTIVSFALLSGASCPPPISWGGWNTPSQVLRRMRACSWAFCQLCGSFSFS